MHAGPGGSGLSRKAIMEQIDASLTRLGTDYVDLYQIHRFDPQVPVEETMEALHDVVKAGKARYIGASAMWAWQFAKMQHAADASRLDAVRLDAGPVQPDVPRGGARDVRPPRRPGGGQHPVQPAREGPPRPPFGEHTKRFDNDPVGRAHFGDGDEGIISAVQQIAEGARHPDGAGRSGLGAAQPGRLGADRRRDEVASPLRCRRGARGRA